MEEACKAVDESKCKLERSMDETPTWAITTVCFVLLVISIFIEKSLHHVGKWLKKNDKKSLYIALKKIKAELMLLGFLSLLLAIGKEPISRICISKSVGDTWHPCEKKLESKSKSTYTPDKCKDEDKVAFVSSYAIYQLHKFIFVLAVFHVLYCITTLALGRTKMRIWKVWEDETKTIEYQYTHAPERFRFTRDTSFGRRHLNFWSRSTFLLWIVSFFRQFFRSVDRVDYLTLRHGFVAAHLAPGSETTFDFLKYIIRTLDEDFTVVVEIHPLMWFFALLFLLSNTHGSHAYLWLPFIPLIIILLVGAKLHVIITKMGLRILDRGDVVLGTPVVQLGDDLFWFNYPRLILYLINFVLFQNAFQLAFFAWSVMDSNKFFTYEFHLRSCYHKRLEDIIIRISMGVLIQFLCSYVTLPLYALVTQMGSNMKPTIFNDGVAAALHNWHHNAKRRTKHSRHSAGGTPWTSRPTTPTHGMSPVHHLHNYHSINNLQTSNFDNVHWDAEGSTTHFNHDGMDGSDQHNGQVDLGEQQQQQTLELSSRTQEEVDISSSNFSFDKRQMS